MAFASPRRVLALTAMALLVVKTAGASEPGIVTITDRTETVASTPRGSIQLASASILQTGFCHKDDASCAPADCAPEVACEPTCEEGTCEPCHECDHVPCRYRAKACMLTCGLRLAMHCGLWDPNDCDECDDGGCFGHGGLCGPGGRFGYFCPSGGNGKGLPLAGKYSAVYPLQLNTRDPRDNTLYAAQGYGVPISVPLAPTVRHTYNFGWGIPSSRLTPHYHNLPKSPLALPRPMPHGAPFHP